MCPCGPDHSQIDGIMYAALIVRSRAIEFGACDHPVPHVARVEHLGALIKQWSILCACSGEVLLLPLCGAPALFRPAQLAFTLTQASAMTAWIDPPNALP